jgi:VWFA-related protein
VPGLRCSTLKVASLTAFFVLFGCLALGQQQSSSQDIPDAPSASKPPQQFPTTPPPGTGAPQSPAEDEAAPAPSRPPRSDSNGYGQPVGTSSSTASGSGNNGADAGMNTAAPPPPMPPVTTVPPGSVPPAAPSTPAQEELYRVSVNVNFVLVPVTVKDNDGRLVAGLQSKDFTVLENGVRQPLKFFTSDPPFLSAAILIDTGMPDVAVQKVNKTFPALQGVFSQWDEVGIYTFSSTVGHVSDFSTAPQQVTAALNRIKSVRGSNNGPPVLSGPLASQTPIVNGAPIDQPVNPVVTPPKTARVLNDAVLAAALDLAKRPRTNRKIIFIISDGREFGSKASYADVLKVLLTNNILVYAVGVEGAALPGYGKLQRLTHLPHYGYSDILPKYVNATGGEVFNELSPNDLEIAYSNAIGDARNQYTLGYTTRATVSTQYRDIEVRVHRPLVKVTAKVGYYPLPPTPGR